MSKLFMPTFITLLFLSIIFPIFHALSCSPGCNHGKCISGNKCACKPGYFDSVAPCDAEVPSLYNKRYIQKIVPANGWAYSYIPLGNITSDVQLQFQAIEGTATAYILLQSNNSYKLPTRSDDSLLITPTNNADNTRTYSFTRQEVQATNGGWLTLALYNSGNLQARVRVQYVAHINGSSHFDDDDENDMNSVHDLVKAIIIIPVLIVGVLLCAGVYVKIKVEGLRNRQLQVSPLEARENYEIVVVVGQTPPPTPENQKQKDLLSQEEIQYFFPKRAFSQLKTPFPHATCSICLEDFQADSECHQFYCYHIFHEECIGEWLAKHDSCPDCRKPITKEAIKNFFRERRKQRKEQQRQSMEQEQRAPSVHIHY